jgi:hypothetical protein
MEQTWKAQPLFEIAGYPVYDFDSDRDGILLAKVELDCEGFTQDQIKEEIGKVVQLYTGVPTMLGSIVKMDGLSKKELEYRKFRSINLRIRDNGDLPAKPFLFVLGYTN